METTNNHIEISSNWIEGLALDELNMEETGTISVVEQPGPIHLLEESSIKLMDNLREYFEIYVNKFNEYRGGTGNSAKIKIFKIANTVNDFILFRNSLRLIVTRKANDLITIGFLSTTGELLPSGQSETTHRQTTHELRAHVGPFNSITWCASGEAIETHSVVRYYLSDFIRNSAR